MVRGYGLGLRLQGLDGEGLGLRFQGLDREATRGKARVSLPGSQSAGFIV